MLYGIGIAIDEGKYRYNNGFNEFLGDLIKVRKLQQRLRSNKLKQLLESDNIN